FAVGARHREHLAPNRPPPSLALDAEVRALPEHRRVHLAAAALDDRPGLFALAADHRRTPLLDDPGLLPRDLGDRRAEYPHVVEADGTQHAHIPPGHIRRVPRATHADLEYAQAHGPAGDPQEGQSPQPREVGDAARRGIL